MKEYENYIISIPYHKLDETQQKNLVTLVEGLTRELVSEVNVPLYLNAHHDALHMASHLGNIGRAIVAVDNLTAIEGIAPETVAVQLKSLVDAVDMMVKEAILLSYKLNQIGETEHDEINTAKTE